MVSGIRMSELSKLTQQQLCTETVEVLRLLRLLRVLRLLRMLAAKAKACAS